MRNQYYLEHGVLRNCLGKIVGYPEVGAAGDSSSTSLRELEASHKSDKEKIQNLCQSESGKH